MKNSGQSIQVLLCAAGLIVTGLLLTGCRTATGGRINTGVSMPDGRVILMPGDLIEVKFFYTPELNEAQSIRPDGKITLQLIGDVVAAGFSPSRLQDNLKEKYTGLIENPSVAVIVRDLAHRKVYVAGEVLRPGLQPMPGHTTALEAIMQAGGFDMRAADPQNVVVLRGENGSMTSYFLDFKEILAGEAGYVPFYLRAQDIIYVPRTGIVKVNQWVDQYITQLIPKTGFSVFYDTGSSSSVIGVDTTSKY